MKQIQPVSIWYYGENKQAILFNMTITSDNLSTQATFFYALYSDPNFQLAAGNITITGEDYLTFTTSSDSNEYAYQWGASQLNLTLVVDIFKVEMPTNELINTIPITLSNI